MKRRSFLAAAAGVLALLPRNEAKTVDVPKPDAQMRFHTEFHGLDKKPVIHRVEVINDLRDTDPDRLMAVIKPLRRMADQRVQAFDALA